MLAIHAGAILGVWTGPITTPPPGSTTLHFLPNHQCTGAGEYSDADGKHPYCSVVEPGGGVVMGPVQTPRIAPACSASMGLELLRRLVRLAESS